ncbi:MAG: hypothetical protein IPP77_04135 [Bacteroidetes bacterium]|nr:hypothetical protein [Bacteroidota bacterium]
MELIAGFKEIFPNETLLSLHQYCQGASRNWLLHASCHIAGFRLHNSKFEKYDDFISMWFRPNNHEFAQQVYNRCCAFEKERGPFRIVNPIASLTLFEFVYGLPHQEQTIPEETVEINLFKAYLSSSDDWIVRETAGLASVKNVNEDLRTAAHYLLASFYKHELLNTDLLKSAITQYLKAECLFDFLSTYDEKTKHLLSRFLEYYECVDSIEYFKKILPLFSILFAVDKKEGDTRVSITRDEHFEIGCRFFDKLSLIETGEIKDDDFSVIRAFPFYKIPGEKGEYRIIYDLFVIDKIFRGLYFKLKELHDAKDYSIDKKFKDFRGYIYCDRFSEKYLLANVLNKIAAGNYFAVSEDDAIRIGIAKSAPDFYLRKDNAILIFESKDVLIKKRVKQSFDYLEITEEMKHQFAGKAISQLVGNIRRILIHDWPIDTGIVLETVRIYPVLVTHYETFNASGLNYILNYWFQEELDKLRQEGLNISCVLPLVCMDIDTLIYFQDIFREEKAIEVAIQEYLKFVHLVPTKILLPTELLIKYKEESNYPFSYYLRKEIEKLDKEFKGPKAFLELVKRLEPKN